MSLQGPWIEGPRELLQHASDHMRLGGDFDRRIAMISIDNAVELAVKTYLGLPDRARGARGPSRNELDSASQSFPSLLDLLERFAANKLTGVELADLEWYHRLRNQLYHSGNGITVEGARVEMYFQLAVIVFENLFGLEPRLDEVQVVNTKTGEFLNLWTRLGHGLRAKLPPKEPGDYAYYWKRDFLRGISEEVAQLWESLTMFRNNLVHSSATPLAPEMDRRIGELKYLMGRLGVDDAS